MQIPQNTRTVPSRKSTPVPIPHLLAASLEPAWCGPTSCGPVPPDLATPDPVELPAAPPDLSFEALAQRVAEDPDIQGLIGRKAYYLADKLGVPDERRDYESELTIELLRRLHLYDPSRGSLGAFSNCILTSAVASAKRDRRAKKRGNSRPHVSLNTRLVTQDWECLEYAEVLPDEPDRHLTPRESPSVEALELQIDLRRVLATFSPALVETCRAAGEFTVKEMTEIHGIGRSSIYRRIARIRRQFEKAGLQIYLGLQNQPKPRRGRHQGKEPLRKRG